MNRRTFLAALGIAPAVAVAKPETKPCLIPLAIIDPECASPKGIIESSLTVAQRELVNAKQREILLCGGYASGKTHGVVAWCRDTPGDKIVALPSGFAFQPFHEKAGRMGGRYTRNSATITFESGTRVKLIHPGTPSNSLRGLGILKIAFDGIVADDFDKLWLELAEREALPFYWQQVVYSVRPTSSSAALYRKFFDHATRWRRVIHCDIAGNPHVDQNYRALLRDVDPRYVNGEWT